MTHAVNQWPQLESQAESDSWWSSVTQKVGTLVVWFWSEWFFSRLWYLNAMKYDNMMLNIGAYLNRKMMYHCFTVSVYVKIFYIWNYESWWLDIEKKAKYILVNFMLMVLKMSVWYLYMTLKWSWKIDMSKTW